MAGLIAALTRGKNRNEATPLPGIGGYDMPRGPYGEGGFPGSTPAAAPVHPQTAEGRRERQLAASQAQDDWKTLPTRRVNGTPRQPYARNKKQADDTERRSSPVLAAGVPGNENQRNSRYYGGRRAAPGVSRTVMSAPNPANPATPVTIPSDRYVFDGVNGGVESYAVDRRIPYRIHARPPGYRGDGSVRGADLSGQRYTMAADQNINQGGNGAFGIGRERGPIHRPVKFVRPGPWTANYRDEAPDEGTQAPNMVHRSPSARGKVTTKKKHKKKPELAHRGESRHLPEHRGRTGRGTRRG